MMKMSLLFDILRLTYGTIRAKKNLVGAHRSSWYDQNGFFVYFWYIMKIDVVSRIAENTTDIVSFYDLFYFVHINIAFIVWEKMKILKDLMFS